MKIFYPNNLSTVNNSSAIFVGLARLIIGLSCNRTKTECQDFKVLWCTKSAHFITLVENNNLQFNVINFL